MSDSDWHRCLHSVDKLAALYSHLPALEQCKLMYVHIDEREDSVTLGFSTQAMPTNLPQEWMGTEFNTVEFYVRCSQVAELKVAGWDSTQAMHVEFSRDAQGWTRIGLGTSGSGIAFRSPSVIVTKTRSYLATAAP
ncbi:hypothetical protein EF913_04235 [Streptomyces sp. WAC04189]|uniref:Imm50 family immunity protein n=1 Tax=Streptomyces TaxID=1883 RepID=UPI000FBC3F16|nr:Imm50 family immunity protein [Streptomyces sp. WAC04189]RSS06343.1 hypothetical protein EF913_04235 [Streptomyces sp. WAC04189]